MTNPPNIHDTLRDTLKRVNRYSPSAVPDGGTLPRMEPRRSLGDARHRLAKLRDELKQCVESLKVGSTAYKTMKGRWGGVLDAIEIVDQELLAEEQGAATGSITCDGSFGIQNWGKCP